MEIQQSPLYTTYVASLGWQILRLPEGDIFIRRFPLIGGYAKIQRFTKLPQLATLIPLLKSHKVTRVAVEPDASVNQARFQSWMKEFSCSFRVSHDHFLPTKTIHIDLTLGEENIFQNFSEAKRRAVRRAQKNNLIVKESGDIKTFIRLKNKSAGFLGFITTSGIDKLWQIFFPQHAAILLAYRNSPAPPLMLRGGKGGVIVAGVLLLFWDKVAYYWIAAATKKGKRLFAPTLLVWEALKLAKRRSCTSFDFVGVWDERLPRQNRSWIGFTKFKEGFGGKELYYPICLK